MDANSVSEEGSSCASNTLFSSPLSTQKVSWGTGVRLVGESDALSSDKSVSSIARGTSSVGVVESLAERVSSCAHSVVEEGTSGASEALSSLPLGAEKVSGWCIVWLIGETDALAEVESIASVARSTGSVGAVEGFALRIRLCTNAVSEEGSSSASEALLVSPLSAEKIRW